MLSIIAAASLAIMTNVRLAKFCVGGVVFCRPQPRFWAVDLACAAYLGWVFSAVFRRKRAAALLTYFVPVATFALACVKYVALHDWLAVTDLLYFHDLYLAFSGWLVALGALSLLAAVIVCLRSLRSVRAIPGAVALIGVIWTPALFEHSDWYGENFFQRGIAYSLTRGLSHHFEALALEPREWKATELPTITGKSKRNLYVLIMESFFDPTDVWTLDESPIDERFRRWRGGTSYSPVFGGFSAQAEMELICGIPIVPALGTLVMKHLGGAPIDCLPQRLRQAGYATEAQCAEDPYFFNARLAYRSFGFETAVFDNQFAHDDLDGNNVSNDAAVRVSAEAIRKRLRAGRPFFAHRFFTAGHVPYRLNPAKRPLRFRVRGAPIVNRLLSSLYYNSRAIADHAEWIVKEDPRALILIIGDHQGAGEGPAKPNPGPLARQGVPYILLDAGAPQHLGDVSHFDWPHILLARLEGRRPTTLTRAMGYELFRPMAHDIFVKGGEADKEALRKLVDGRIAALIARSRR